MVQREEINYIYIFMLNLQLEVLYKAFDFALKIFNFNHFTLVGGRRSSELGWEIRK